MLLAPTINILRHPRWGRAQETYGEDTFHLGRMGVGFVRGAQQHVIASAKHFAANSIEDTRFVVDVTVDERSLREVYLPHFRIAVQQGHVGSVMSAYNQVNGHYCAENSHLLHDILKGDWGFQGFVESDWILGTHSTVPSAIAGLDIEMPFAVYFGQALVDAVNGGGVPEASIDAAVRRILRAKLCFRLDTDPPVANPGLVESPAHVDLALEVARKSIVLLKNDGDGAAARPLAGGLDRRRREPRDDGEHRRHRQQQRRALVRRLAARRHPGARGQRRGHPRRGPAAVAGATRRRSPPPTPPSSWSGLTSGRRGRGPRRRRRPRLARPPGEARTSSSPTWRR